MNIRQMSSIKLGIVVACSMAVTTLFYSHDSAAMDPGGHSAKHSRGHGGHGRGVGVINRLDVDGSGGVSLDEFLARRLDRAERRFDRKDADDDGVISEEEYSVRPERTPRGARGIDNFDLETFKTCMESALGESFGKPTWEERLTSDDANGDGAIDEAEFVDAIRASEAERFSELDVDSSGEVDQSELTAARMAKRENRQAKRDAKRMCIEQQRV